MKRPICEKKTRQLPIYIHPRKSGILDFGQAKSKKGVETGRATFSAVSQRGVAQISKCVGSQVSKRVRLFLAVSHDPVAQTALLPTGKGGDGRAASSRTRRLLNTTRTQVGNLRYSRHGCLRYVTAEDSN